jgi:type IV pilus assembly protein PilE
MQSRSLTRFSRLRGFTLVELMIVVVIGSILLGIAVPSYMSSIRKTRRSEAKTAILELAGREERYLSTNPAGYSTTPSDVGYVNFTTPVGNGYYTVAVCVTASGAASACAPSTLVGPSYLITATPVAGTSQASDTQCTSFSVDSGGGQRSSDAKDESCPEERLPIRRVDFLDNHLSQESPQCESCRWTLPGKQRPERLDLLFNPLGGRSDLDLVLLSLQCVQTSSQVGPLPYSFGQSVTNIWAGPPILDSVNKSPDFPIEFGELTF